MATMEFTEEEFITLIDIYAANPNPLLEEMLFREVPDDLYIDYVIEEINYNVDALPYDTIEDVIANYFNMMLENGLVVSENIEDDDFNIKPFQFVYDLYKKFLKKTLRDNEGYIVKHGSHQFALNPNFIEIVADQLESYAFDGNYENLVKKEGDLYIPDYIKASNIFKIDVRQEREGTYFKYQIKKEFEHLDLSSFQIFSENQEVDDRLKEHCWISTLYQLRDNYYKNYDNLKGAKNSKKVDYRKDVLQTQTEESAKSKLEHYGEKYADQETYIKTIDTLIARYKILIGCDNFKTRVISKQLPNNVQIKVGIQKKIDSKVKYNYYPKILKEKKNLVILYIDLVENHYIPHFRVPYNSATISKVQKNKGALKINQFLKLLQPYLEPSKHNYMWSIPSLDIMNLKLDESFIREHEHKEPKNKKAAIYYCDFESVVYNPRTKLPKKKHKPFMLGYVKEDEEKPKVIRARTIINSTCNDMFLEMLDDIIANNNSKLHILYFHNARYDYALIRHIGRIYITNELKKQGTLYAVNFTYNKKKFLIKDSFKFVPTRLASFMSTFKLKAGKKDFGIYNCVDMNTIIKPNIEIEKMKRRLDERENFTPEKIEEFMNENKEWIEDGKFRLLDFYEDYLISDCTTLRDGINTFAKILREEEIFKCNLHNFYTISSLADYIVSKAGCYDGVCEVTANIQEYIMESVVGGRVQMSKNLKQVYKGKVQDFDWCSLYPSACKFAVIPKGKPIIVNDESTDVKVLNEKYYQYICTATYIIRKPLPISMYSVKVGEKRVWGGHDNQEITQVIDKVTLEDLVEFQDAEIVKIHTGYFWPISQGKNTKLNELIQKLYDIRLEAKKEGNTGLANVLKLLLNSIYGKNIIHLKNITTDLIPRNKLNSYIASNYRDIVSIDNIDDDKNGRYEVKRRSYALNFNRAHVGAFILSYSKRLVNQVVALAHENNVELFYTDTDSLHMKDEDVELLAEKYKLKYGRDLIGEQLGQTHTDFDTSYFVGKFKKQMIKDEKFAKHIELLVEKYVEKYEVKVEDNFNFNNYIGEMREKTINDPEFIEAAINVYSRHFIAVGKKCYLDILTTKEPINGKFYETEHVRFKGAAKENIKAFCKENDMTLLEFYEYLYDGNKVELDLCNGKVRFEFDNKGVRSVQKMKKIFKF